MRVAHDVSIQGGREPTGVERAQATLIDALLAADADHELLLLTPGRVPARWREHPRVRVHEGRGGPIWLWREAVVPTVVRRERAELFHSPVAALPLRVRAPKIATVHEVPWAGPDAGPGDARARHRLRLELAARFAWRLVCPSERTAEHVRRLHPEAAARVRVLHHALAPPLVPLPERAPARDPGLLLSVGRLRAKKDLGVLLEAVARLGRQRAPAPRLVVVGPDGEAAGELRARAAAPDLAGRVDLPGFVDDGALASLYARAACVVLPSRFEGFGLPALEAMAAGAPVVAARGGVVDELAGDAALVVDGGDPAALAAALARVLDDAQLAARLAEAGRERAARFDLPRLRAAVLALYAEPVP